MTTMHEVKEVRPLTAKQYRRFKPCPICRHEFYSALGQKQCQVCVAEINRKIIAKEQQS